jgi:ABC-type long-subunit fatty acid transport system fused permease/ATPase subunit
VVEVVILSEILVVLMILLEEEVVSGVVVDSVVEDMEVLWEEVEGSVVICMDELFNIFKIVIIYKKLTKNEKIFSHFCINFIDII